MTQEQIDNNYIYHEPKSELRQVERYQEIRNAFKSVAELLNEKCPESRELSVAFTNLEQAMFWANASIARNE